MYPGWRRPASRMAGRVGRDLVFLQSHLVSAAEAAPELPDTLKKRIQP